MSWLVGLILFLIVSGLVTSGAKETGGAVFVVIVAAGIILNIMVTR
jgi:hypothetical protein